MQHKDIKNLIRKQLKSKYPNWKRRTKKEKKAIAAAVLNEVVSNYDFNQPVLSPVDELIGIKGQIPTRGVIPLYEMERYIENNKSDRLFFTKVKQHPLLAKDRELSIIDNLLDDQIINRLLSYQGYSPAMREYFPCTYLRAELLKAIKYPEISYRKFCTKDYMGMDQKLNRVFIGLGLNKKRMIHHVQLSQFRSNLGFDQMVNLMIYVIHHFMKSGLLGEQTIHCIDSTELAVDNQELLATVEINGQKIRIYDDIDCDCGRRRKKRDKSVYVVGYRMHTLTAIDAKTGKSYPLISLLAPANHHDRHFHLPLVQLGKAIGLQIKLITADEAYCDRDGSFYNGTGVHLITPPRAKVLIPENVDLQSMQVTYDEQCEIPMHYMGVDDCSHEFKCAANPGECFRESVCPKFRLISIDSGHFQRIFHNKQQVTEAIDIRKNGERPFNLLKKREGLETVRVRSQHSLLARCTFTTMATLLLEIADTRRKVKPKSKNKQLELPFAA